MPRENSFSDSDGRSLTPDLDEAIAAETPHSPVSSTHPPVAKRSAEHTRPHGKPSLKKIEATFASPATVKTPSIRSHHEMPPQTPGQAQTAAQFSTPIQRFRAAAKKVVTMRKMSYMMARGGVGAEPGIDPRRDSAYINYGHIKQKCLIEVADYSAVRSSFGRMTNNEFIKLLADERASAKEPWVKVRWINVGGISWDVISALALKYG